MNNRRVRNIINSFNPIRRPRRFIEGSNSRTNQNLTRQQFAFRNRLTGITNYDDLNSLLPSTQQMNSHFGNLSRGINIRSQRERSIDNNKEKEKAIDKRIEKFESFMLEKASVENHCNICMDDEAKDVTMIQLTCSHLVCKSCLKDGS